MASKTDTTPDAPTTDAPEVVEQPKRRSRPEGVKRVGADFNEDEYAVLRELRFTQRHDKDSDVIRAALKSYAEANGETWPTGE